MKQKLDLLDLLPLFLLIGCTPLVYQETTYGLDEFIADSSQISPEKLDVHELGQQGSPCLSTVLEPCDEIVLDGDELKIVLYNSKRQDRLDAFQRINQTIGFRVSNGKNMLASLRIDQCGWIDVK